MGRTHTGRIATRALCVGLVMTGWTFSPRASAAPKNIDSGLQKLMAQQAAATASVANGMVAPLAKTAPAAPGRFDATGRVLVHVNLNGAAPMNSISTALTAMGARMLGTNGTYRSGVMAAYLPTAKIAAAAGTKGVRSLTMEYAPVARVGKVTSQGTAVLHTDLLNKVGLKGDGITVGVLSDSFDMAYQFDPPPATRAADDVASGDLPVVNVLEDYPYGGDEGRAMCQIVYDEAPHCRLAFATAATSEVDFANNIVALRTQAGANVIVDDYGYYDEPVFSDGMVANAVDQVATSRALPGKPVVYLSAAGNDGNNGYRSAYRNLSDTEVRKAGNHGNLKLNVKDPAAANYLDPSLTAGGWLNWNPNGGNEPVTTIMAPGPTTDIYLLFLQWDDLFDQADGITTSYNFLVFDAQGNFLPYQSSTGSAFDYQEPIQAIGFLSLGTNYQIAITKITQTDPLAGPIPPTHHLALYSTLDGLSQIEGKYFSPAPLNVPGTFGHPSAKGAISVAAYDYSWRAALPFAPEIENFTSPGPSTFYFDENLNRLTKPEVRQKPEVAGVDGVVTTFFGSPYYSYPYAFFGTSAAAPSVAGVVALMEQASGGAGVLSPSAIKLALEASAHPRTSTPEATSAFASDATSAVSVSALGEWYFGPNYFTVSFIGASSDDIEQVTIDGTTPGLLFDTTSFVVGNTNGISAQDVTVVAPSASTSKFTLKFKKGTFKSGATISFSLVQDEINPGPGYAAGEYGVGSDAEDLAFGATATVSFGAAGHAAMGLEFRPGPATLGYQPADGYGLVDAILATLNVLPLNCAFKVQGLE